MDGIFGLVSILLPCCCIRLLLFGLILQTADIEAAAAASAAAEIAECVSDENVTEVGDSIDVATEFRVASEDTRGPRKLAQLLAMNCCCVIKAL